MKFENYLFAILLFSFFSCGFVQDKTDSNSVVAEQKKTTHFQFPEPIGLVNDFESILNPVEIEMLERKLIDYEQKTSRQIAVVTVDSIGSYRSIKNYSLDLFNEWGIGQKETNNGLLILVSKNLREIQIRTGLGTEKVLTDSICKDVMDKLIIPKLMQGEYYKGIDDGINSFIENWK